MKKSDLKPGYVVETRDGHRGVIVISSQRVDDLMIAYFDTNYRDGYDPINLYSDNMLWASETCENDIVKVYGYASTPKNLLDPEKTIMCRELIWERKKAKKMTVKEICDALGYEVEIVKEK